MLQFISFFCQRRLRLGILRNITSVFFAATALALIALTAWAESRTVEYEWFTLTLPPGWQADAPKELAGAWTLSLRNEQQGAQVAILAGKTAGPPDAADVAGLLRAACGVREPLRRVNGRYVFTGKDAQGMDTACTVSADRNAGLYLAILRAGNVAAGETLLSGLRSERYPDLLP